MCQWNKTDNKVVLPNGATFLFKGLDNPERLNQLKVSQTLLWKRLLSSH